MKHKVESIGGAHYHYFKVFDGREQVGYAVVRITDMPHYTFRERCNTTPDKCANIEIIKTVKSHKKQGIATAILDKVVKKYKKYDLFLQVIPLDMDNTVATLTNFYEKFGFKRCESGGSTPTMVKPASI